MSAKVVSCASCGAPHDGNGSVGLSFVCEYCGSHNLLGKRVAPEYDDSRIELLLAEVDRRVKNVKTLSDPERVFGDLITGKVDSMQRLLADFYGSLPERLERPICKTSDLYLRLIGAREVINYFRLLLFHLHPKSYESNLSDHGKNQNKGREIPKWKKMLKEGKINGEYELYSSVNSYFYKLKNRALYRGLSKSDLKKIYFYTFEYFEKFSHELYLDLFTSLSSCLDLREKNKSIRQSVLAKMTQIESRGKMIFLIRLGECIRNDFPDLQVEEIENVISKIYSRFSVSSLILNLNQDYQDTLIARFAFNYWKSINDGGGGGDELTAIKAISERTTIRARSGIVEFGSISLFPPYKPSLLNEVEKPQSQNNRSKPKLLKYSIILILIALIFSFVQAMYIKIILFLAVIVIFGLGF